MELLLTGNSEKYSMTSVSADNYKKVIKINGKDYELDIGENYPECH